MKTHSCAVAGLMELSSNKNQTKENSTAFHLSATSYTHTHHKHKLTNLSQGSFISRVCSISHNQWAASGEDQDDLRQTRIAIILSGAGVQSWRRLGKYPGSVPVRDSIGDAWDLGRIESKMLPSDSQCRAEEYAWWGRRFYLLLTSCCHLRSERFRALINTTVTGLSMD